MIQLKHAILAGAVVTSFCGGWTVRDNAAQAEETDKDLIDAKAAASAAQAHSDRLTTSMDGWVGQLQRELRAAGSAHADLERLRRSLPAGSAASAAGSTCHLERARIGVLEQLLSEGAGLVEEGGRHVEQLRGEQSALKGLAIPY